MRNTNQWNDKEWKRIVKDHVEGKTCSWCNSSEKLLVHHTEETKKKRYQEYRRLYEKYLVEAIEKGEYEQAYEGKQQKLTLKPDYYPGFSEKIKPIINLELDNMGLKVPVYYDMHKDTIILCVKCHFAIHNNLVLCKLCGEGYHKTHKEMCSNCDKKLNSDKWLICSECEKEKYDSSLWKMCYKCFNKKLFQ